MTRFDTIAVVDWSGGNDTGRRPRKDAIWAAVVRGGHAERPVYLRNRVAAEEWLAALFEADLAAGRRVFAGFDFPFGYPHGFARHLTGRDDPLGVWDWFATNLDDTPRANNRYALAGRIKAWFPGIGPFWFNGTTGDIPDLPRKGRSRREHGMPERRLCEQCAKGTFTCWQMGGAGAVGSQVMTGMAVLARLRRRFTGHIAVWPFEPLDTGIALVEVWPSLNADIVKEKLMPGDIKDAVQVRVLAAQVAGMQEKGTLCRMLAAVPARARSEEGWIFGLPAAPCKVAA